MNLLKIRERAVLIFLIILPFHAVLVTVLTKVFAGPDQSPLVALALWKEALLGFILIIALFEMMHDKRSVRFDTLDWLIAALLLLAIGIGIFMRTDISLFALGFKYDLLPLAAFVLLRRVAWSSDFLRRASTVFLWLGGVVASVGIAFFFLPQGFLRFLGYSDLHSLYLPGGPLAPFQQIGSLGIRRMQSVMSGPNQLGLWLLLPWSVATLRILLHWQRANWRRVFYLMLYIFLVDVAIVLTFSRAAWIAAFSIILFATIHAVLRSRNKMFIEQGKLILAVICALFALSVLSALLMKPSIIIRPESSIDHVARPLAALRRMTLHPFGTGLGKAGPASNRVSDTCVYLEKRSDFRWAKDHPNLCIFLQGDPGKFTQVQPRFESCDCPFLPENWYLQIGVELGILGCIFFVWLIALLLWKLPKDSFVFFAMLGVALAGMVLHSWEDSAVSYSVWILSAVAIGMKLSKASSREI